jgi:TP901 family phage tail tape measure protein
MAKLRLDLQLTGFKQASGKLKQFGNKMKSVGSSLQRFSLPMAIAGGAAIKMASDFDKNITKIEALVGRTGKELDSFAEASKRMANETGISSAKTSEAMFFIASAGLEGANAISVLEQASKASASGLGDVAQIADLATSALNAYGSETLSAEGATDVLTAAVREGKLSSEELAGAMGGVLPIASNLGVSFDEVGATLAAMSRTGTNAANGATQLNSILAGLLKPTNQAEDALRSMGLSSAGLKQQIKDEGLLSVLETLKTEFDANSDAAAQVFPNIRALKGVLDLTGKSADTTKIIFDKLSKAQGSTKKAFDATAKSASFKLKKALNSTRESFTQMGSVLLTGLLPAIQNITGAITRLFTAFTNLDGTTQQIILGAGALVIALPTLIGLFGTLTTIIGALLSPVGLIAAGLAGIAYIIATNWSEVAPVLVGLYNRFVDLYNSSILLRVVIGGLKSVFKTAFIAARTQILRLSNSFQTMWLLIKEFSEKGFKGSFLKILAEGHKKGKQINKEGGEEIAHTFAEEYQKALDSQLSHATVDGLNTALTNAGDKAKGLYTSFLDQIGIGSGGGGGGESGGDDSSGGEIKAVEDIGKVEKKTDELKEKFLNLALTSNMVGEEISNAFMGAFESMMEGENFFKSLIKGLMALIKKLIAAAVAAFVLSTLLGGLGIGGIEKGAKGFKKMFGKLSGIGEFANGGIVNSPTLGLMGEYPGARSNPEVIAPLDKLKSMIGDQGGSSQVQVSGQFALKGQDLVVALQRADRNRNRIK